MFSVLFSPQDTEDPVEHSEALEYGQSHYLEEGWATWTPPG